MQSISEDVYLRNRRWGNITPNGVVFIDELASINGCNFILIKSKNVTCKKIADAKRWLKNNRDVVKFYVVNVENKQ